MTRRGAPRSEAGSAQSQDDAPAERQPVAARDKWSPASPRPTRRGRKTAPDEFEIGRDPKPHVGFGGGLHFCSVANAQRVERRYKSLVPTLHAFWPRRRGAVWACTWPRRNCRCCQGPAEKTPGIWPAGRSPGRGPTSSTGSIECPSGWTAPQRACPHAQGSATSEPSRGGRATKA